VKKDAERTTPSFFSSQSTSRLLFVSAITTHKKYGIERTNCSPSDDMDTILYSDESQSTLNAKQRNFILDGSSFCFESSKLIFKKTFKIQFQHLN
jgi:hypothetical protein